MQFDNNPDSQGSTFEEVDSIILPDGTPVLPRDGLTSDQAHRIMSAAPLVQALVHRLLTPSEVRGNADAEKAIIKEKDKLVGRGTWSEKVSDVREWSHVAREARLSGKVAHSAHIFPIVSIKNAELPISDTRRIHKGRIV